VLVDLLWYAVGIRSSAYLIPVKCLQVQSVHLTLIVIASTHASTDEVHVLARDDCLVVRDGSWDGPMHVALFPVDRVLSIRSVVPRQHLQISESSQVKLPQVVHCPDADIIATKNVHPVDSQMLESQRCIMIRDQV